MCRANSSNILITLRSKKDLEPWARDTMRMKWEYVGDAMGKENEDERVKKLFFSHDDPS